MTVNEEAGRMEKVNKSPMKLIIGLIPETTIITF
jgi:hypothetical protein